MGPMGPGRWVALPIGPSSHGSKVEVDLTKSGLYQDPPGLGAINGQGLSIDPGLGAPGAN